MNDLAKARDTWQTRLIETQNMSKNVKARVENVKACNYQHGFQQEVYRVVRSHVFRVGNDLNQEVRSLQELFDGLKIAVTPLLKNFGAVMDELRKTQIHSALVPILKAFSLLELVDEKKVINLYETAHKSFTAISESMEIIKSSVFNIKEDIEKIDRTRLDDSYLKELSNANATMTEISNSMKSFINNMQELTKTAGLRFNDLKMQPINLRNENSYESVLKNYAEFPRLISAVVAESDKSVAILEQTQRAKVNATRAMMKNLLPVGQVLLNYQHMIKMISFVRTDLSKLQPLIIEIRVISKLSSTYKEYLAEIKRRNTNTDKSEKLIQRCAKKFESMFQTENTERKAFQELHESSYLKPLAVLLNKPPRTFRLNVLGEESALPDVGPLPSAIEDDFYFLEEGNTEERLKKCEKENGELVVKINSLVQDLSEKKAKVEEQEKQITSLNSLRHSNVSKSLKEESSKLKESENEALKEQNIKMSQENQTLQKRIQLLLAQLDNEQQNSAQKLQEYQQKIEDYQQQMSEQQQKVLSFEQKITDLESNNPDIKYLLDMGFSLELARKAINSTNSLDAALQWILEASRV